MAAAMHYGGPHGDLEYAVELFDRVECRLDGRTYAGQVTKLYPRLSQVRVRYEDHFDIARTTGEPRSKSARFHVTAVDLVGRDA